MKDLSQPKIETAADEGMKIYGEVHISRTYCKSLLSQGTTESICFKCMILGGALEN